VSVEKQATLDHIVLEQLRKGLEEMKKGLSELAERVVRVEVNADVSQTGLNEIYKSLEMAGIMRDGESVEKAESWNAEDLVG